MHVRIQSHELTSGSSKEFCLQENATFNHTYFRSSAYQHNYSSTAEIRDEIPCSMTPWQLFIETEVNISHSVSPGTFSQLVKGFQLITSPLLQTLTSVFSLCCSQLSVTPCITQHCLTMAKCVLMTVTLCGVYLKRVPLLHNCQMPSSYCHQPPSVCTSWPFTVLRDHLM